MVIFPCGRVGVQLFLLWRSLSYSLADNLCFEASRCLGSTKSKERSRGNGPVILAVFPTHQLVRLGIVRKLFRGWIEFERAAETGGDVAQVAERSGQMSGFNIRRGLLAVFDALEEVAVVRRAIGATAHLFARFVLRSEELPA